MFDLQYLRRFLVVVEEMNITRAAERLHVAQPHLTRCIRSLEDEIGFPLFDRSNKRRIELTAAGRSFYERALSLAKQYDEAIDAGRREAKARRRTLSIAYLPAAMMGVLPPVVQRFRSTHRDVDIRLVDATAVPYHRLLDDIYRRRVDIACGIFPPDGKHDLCRKRMRNAALKAVVPSSHPLAERRMVSFGELKAEPFLWVPADIYPQLWSDVMELWEAEGCRPQVVHTDPVILNLVSLVESGMGVTIATTLTESFVNNSRIAYLRLSGVSYDAGVELIWCEGGSSPLVTAFLLDAETENVLHGPER